MSTVQQITLPKHPFTVGDIDFYNAGKLTGVNLDRYLLVRSVQGHYRDVYKKEIPTSRINSLSDALLERYNRYLIRKGMNLNLWFVPF